MKALGKLSHSERGFTLIEIMIVVLIMGILLAVAIPNFLKARENTRTKTCISSLRLISGAKEQWAMDFKKSASDTPTPDDLTKEGASSGKYLREWPSCPRGGDYVAGIGPVGAEPTCSIGGAHVLF
jgi:prepilin-type N-terminal cleavage/methylation domain-containing protein